MVRQTLAQEITQYLTEQGAVRVGFADLHGVAGASLPYGITALVALPREIVGPLVDQPHRAYYDAYQAINVRLDAMAEGCAALLRAHGYQVRIIVLITYHYSFFTIVVYSYRMASIGSRSAAFLAGYQPKNTPVTVHTANDKNTLHGCIKIGQWATLLTIQLAPQPIITPIIPPVILIRIASIRNWLRISIPRAPTDIRSPISRVRSVTDTYIIFIIPIPPTTSEIPAIQASRVVIRSVVEFSIVLSSCWLRIVKSSSSLSFSLCSRRRILVISSIA